jgi:cell wall-associated NlpC family hydrolase
MSPFLACLSRRSTGVLVGCAVAIFFVLLPDAQAGPTHRRKRPAFSVVLQPFTLARSVVHGVAAPAVHSTRRVMVAAAVTPLKVAYYAPRKARPRPPRGEQVYDAGQDSSGPIRASARDEDPEDQEQDQDEENGQIERGGDRPMVAGSRAVLRNGIAYAPAHAPQKVKNAIWAANSIRRKPYVWGGGHSSFNDRGYDCSGSVSYALRGAGMLSAPLPSSDLMRYGERGRGRWMTIYSRPGHTFAVIAGLRLDTTDLGRGGDVGPRWYAYGRETGGYVARHPAGL